MPSFAINPFYRRWKIRPNVTQEIIDSHYLNSGLQTPVLCRVFYNPIQVVQPQVKMSDFMTLFCIHLWFYLFFPAIVINVTHFCLQLLLFRGWNKNPNSTFCESTSHQMLTTLTTPTSLNQTQSPGRKSSLETSLYLWEPSFTVIWGTVKSRVAKQLKIHLLFSMYYLWKRICNFKKENQKSE